jgi:AraC-like DNA-binding protein
MVCNHCKLVVKSELKKMGLHYTQVDFCEADIDGNISPLQMQQLNVALKRSGLELINDNKSLLCEKIKNLIIETIRYSEDEPKLNLSDYLSEKLSLNYTYLTNVFSEIQGSTIEKFVIAQKIEQIKELLICNDLNLSEIAYKLHYSSLAHLSKQFKDVTGLTPSRYRQLKQSGS